MEEDNGKNSTIINTATKRIRSINILSLVRDLNGLIEKLNTTFQEEKTEDNDAIVFFLGE